MNDWQQGTRVRVLDGAFASFEGVVKGPGESADTMLVEVEMFGRGSTVSMKTASLERLDAPQDPRPRFREEIERVAQLQAIADLDIRWAVSAARRARFSTSP